MINNKDILAEIPNVVASTGGFYNPSSDKSRGEFYLDFNGGIPKAVSIRYQGNISPSAEQFSSGASLYHYKIKKTILIRFLPNSKITDELLFTYSGIMTKIRSVKIHNWRGREFSPRVINYDQTNVYLNYSETKFEDDSIIIKDIKTNLYGFNRDGRKVKKKKHRILSRKLPESYVVASNIERQTCKTCSYWITKYCELWDAPVAANAWCASWKKKGIK